MQSFSGLALAIGLGRLQRLLKREDVTATFLPEFPAVRSDMSGTLQLHTPIFGQMLGRDANDTRPIKLLYNTIFRQKSFNNLKVKDLYPIARLGKFSNYTAALGGNGVLDSLFFSLATDEKSLKLALKDEARIRGVSVDERRIDSLQIETHNLDGKILVLSSESPKDILGGQVLDWSNILGKIQDHAIDSVISQRMATDLVGTTQLRSLATSRIDLSLQRAHRSAEKIDAFQTVVFDGAGGLALAYNQGRISFDEAMRLIDRSTRFREWLVGLPPDAEVLEEYHQALAKEGITDKLPAVTTRFAFFTAAGAGIDALAGTGGLATVASFGLSAFDTFVVDRLLSGWRPNVFVEASQRTENLSFDDCMKRTRVHGIYFVVSIS
ncbi:MAG: hypothetical protein EON58_13610 [Alphaproteobacteria bacterium]|nr:MAG: hypothetical protein EON58_13610 [Alphaproteobacteria bacterium]